MGWRRRGRAALGALATGVLLAACTSPPANPEPGIPTPTVLPSGTASSPPPGPPPPGTPAPESPSTASPHDTGGPSTGTATAEAPGPHWPPVTQPTVIATGLQSPWSVVFHGETPLISERDTGRILQLAPDGSTREIGTVPGMVHAGEGGLLGLAVRGDDLYVYLTTAVDNRIVRFPLISNSNSGSDGNTDISDDAASGGDDAAGDTGSSTGALSLGEPTALVTDIPKAGNHNGGRLAFGPDGLLYATAGDAADPARAQRLDTLGGKILRMTPDGQVPPDNPFPGSLVYSFGHRNPQGLAWADDGTMYAAEFGQNTWDELNIITPGSNYGWPVVEGIAGDDRFVDPVQQWAPADASPSGMAILGDTAYLANLRGQRLRQVPLTDLGTAVERYVGEYGRLRAVTVTPDGALWLLTNNTDGRGDPGPDDDRIIAVPPH